ncbi:MAG: hypothetical protein ACR2N3_18220 [Pyrinomonadaceae bacterium]
MTIEEKENQETQTAPNEENFAASELLEPRWSVVSFESVAVSGVTYDEAAKWMEKLGKQKISGLCIITDEAAARFSK